MPGTRGLSLGLDQEVPTVSTGSLGGHPLGGGRPEPQEGAWAPSLGVLVPGQHGPGQAHKPGVQDGSRHSGPALPALFFFLTACNFCAYFLSVLFSSVSEFVSTLLGRREFLLLAEPERESSEGGTGPTEQERGEP